MSVPVPSLHKRLLVWMLILLALFWAALWIGGRQRVELATSQDVDARLRQTAVLLLQVVPPMSAGGASRDADGPRLQNLAPSANTYAARALSHLPDFEVLTANERVLLRSPAFPVAAHDSEPGYAERFVDDTRWRIFTQSRGDDGVTTRVAMDADARPAGAARLDSDLRIFLLAAIPALAGVAALSVWRGLAPLRRLEAALAAQDPADPQPLDLADQAVPVELRRLTRTLDRLLRRLKDVLTRQKTFVAAAGHELRTPLAGCKTQLEVARRAAPQECEHALAKAGESLDRMSHLAERLLVLARVDRSEPELTVRRFDMRRLLAELIADLESDESAPAVHTSLGNAPLWISGDETLIRAMVSNVLENAARVSPVGSKVEVSLAVDEEGEGLEIRVRDMGPGIAQEDRRRVFDGFQRAANGSGGGAGLGLAIVRAVATAHGGAVALDAAEGGGTLAVMRLPRTR